MTCSDLPDGQTILLQSLGIPPLNPLYVDDPNAPRPAFTIEILRDDVWWDFSKFYEVPTMYIEDNKGDQLGRARFNIVEDSHDYFDLPFLFQPQMKIRIWNYNKTWLYHQGNIMDIQVQILGRRCDGTSIKRYIIESVDAYIELERVVVTEVYKNKTVGFIIKDLIRRFTCLDSSGVDATQGRLVESKNINGQFVGEVLKDLIDFQADWTFWIDPETSIFYAGENADISNKAAIVITDANVFEIFDYSTVSFSKDARGLRNSFQFFYNGVYNRGTVNVGNGDTIVLGTDTLWIDNTNIENGANFRVVGDEKEYSIDVVNSNGNLTLQSAYEGPTDTNVEYEIYGKGLRSAITKSDAVSINQLSQLRGEDGKINAGRYQARITEDNNYFTREEARQIVNSHLLKWSSPMLRGALRSDNTRLVTPIRAGQVMELNIPLTSGVVFDAVIQRILIRDGSAILCDPDNRDGRIDPFVHYDIDFTQRVYDIREQIKRLMRNVEKAAIADSNIVETAYDFPEFILIQDCIDVTEPIVFQENILIADNVFEVLPTVMEETLTIDDNVTITEITQTTPFYTTPTPRQAGYCIGRTKFGAVS